MDALILEQLVWIKWALASVAVALGIIAVFAIFAMGAVASMPELMKGRIGFENQAKALLDQGENKKLLEFCDSHILKFPADAHGYYFMGQAHYRIGNLRQALNCFKKVVELQPDWEASLAQPMIEALELKLREHTEKPELKVLTTESVAKIDPPERSP